MSGKRRWQKDTFEPAKKKAAERRARFSSSSVPDAPPLATPEDAPRWAEPEFPGEYPFTRGIQPTMYRGRLWTMRQYAGFGSAEESNKRYRYLLAQGTTGLSVAFDLPTQIGYDSDDPIAQGEVGKVGVAISSIEDMERLFADIPLDKVTTSMTINAPATVLLALYIAVAEKRGILREKLGGTVQNDILKEYIARGTYIFPPAPSMRLITDLFDFCAREVPKWNTISISGYHIREAGSTAAQELAFTLMDGITYVEAARAKGLDIDSFGPQLSFFFNAHNDLLEEVAKFRAARRMWAKLMRERFGAKDPRSWMLRFHTQTGGSTLTAQQPENNVVRVAVQAMAAVLGGTQSLHTNSMDEALGLPTEKAARIALRTQQIVAEESGIVNTVDPFAGSYYIEWLTDKLEADANAYIARIEEMGGMLRAIERGFVQKEISDAAYRAQQALEAKEAIVVGVNEFAHGGSGAPMDILKVDASIERDQVARLRAFKARRNAADVATRLADLRRAAKTDQNLMPLIIHAVKGGATVGEVCGALRAEWGEYAPPADA